MILGSWKAASVAPMTDDECLAFANQRGFSNTLFGDDDFVVCWVMGDCHLVPSFGLMIDVAPTPIFFCGTHVKIDGVRLDTPVAMLNDCVLGAVFQPERSQYAIPAGFHEDHQWKPDSNDDCGEDPAADVQDTFHNDRNNESTAERHEKSRTVSRPASEVSAMDR